MTTLRDAAKAVVDALSSKGPTPILTADQWDTVDALRASLAATPQPTGVWVTREALARALHGTHGGGPCFARYRNCEDTAAAILAALEVER